MRLRPPILLLISVIGSAVFVAGGAAAQETEVGEAEAVEVPAEPINPEDAAEAAAMTHFHSARGLYDRGAYREALVEFRASYALSRRAMLFYNYSLCYQRLHEYGDAVNYLERYLLEVIDIPNRADLELRLHRMREAAQEEAQAQQPEPEESHAAAWVAFGVGAAGAVAALVAGPLALSERSRLDDDPCSQTSTCDASALRRRALVADIGLGVALAGAATGVLFWFLLGSGESDTDSNTDARARSVRVRPIFGVDAHGGQGGAQLVGSF